MQVRSLVEWHLAQELLELNLAAVGLPGHEPVPVAGMLPATTTLLWRTPYGIACCGQHSLQETQ